MHSCFLIVHDYLLRIIIFEMIIHYTIVIPWYIVVCLNITLQNSSIALLSITVLVLVSQVRDVVLMNVYLGEGNGKFSSRATWERGGRILSQQGGFQVSKERQMGSKRE